MGFFQANYAFGAFIGATISGILAQYNIAPWINFIAMSLFFIILLPFCYIHLLNQELEQETLQEKQANDSLLEQQSTEQTSTEHASELTSEQTSEQITTQAERTQTVLLVALGIIIGIAGMGEGSIGDWCTIFLSETLLLSPFLSAFGYGLYSLVLACSRIYLDYIRASYSVRFILCMSGVFISVGLVIFVLPSLVPGSSLALRIILSYFGLIIIAMGICSTTPVVIATVSDVPNTNTASGIAFVSTFSYLGFLIGTYTCCMCMCIRYNISIDICIYYTIYYCM